MSRSSVAMAAGLASGSYLLATQAFVTPMQAPLENVDSWTPSTMGPAKVTESDTLGNASSVATAVGLAGMFAAAASMHRRSSRTLRRVEPISVAAAATATAKAGAAAKAAAAAKGGAKVAGAVAGSTTTSSLVEASSEDLGDFDPELGGKSNWSPSKRGTPELKKAMDQKRKRNEQAWEIYTGRNVDGNFGDAANAGNVDAYDPFATIGSKFLGEAAQSNFEVGAFNPAAQVGVTEPLGYFDPLGFCAKGDREGFRKLRTAELKHGRVAMMGALGAVVQHYIKFPGFEKVPAGLSAVNEAPGSYGAVALFLFTGALELGVWTESDNKEPGNFGDPLNFCEVGEGYTLDMRNRELNNGRAAMFAVMGIIVAELVTGKDAIEQFGLQ